ncbi:MAG TPA: outer membrane beta-barrel protein [Vicinamibacteria bacterium]|nr:outer membrane beta-barrel protein [Vicinamibacteria bacterium]
MTLLGTLVLAAATARVESVSLTAVDGRLAVRVQVSGAPGLIAVHREGDVARISITDADLGLRFAGGRRFSWTPQNGFDPALIAAAPAKIDRLEIAATTSEVSVLLHVPPDVSVDVRRDVRGLLVVFRQAPVEAPPQRVAQAPAPEPAATLATEPTPPAPAPAAPVPAVAPPPAAAQLAATPAAPPPTPPAAAPVREATAVARVEEAAPPEATPAAPPAPAAQTPAAPAPDTAELARRLFAVPAEGQAAGPASVADLYPSLFPTGPLQALPREAPAAEVTEQRETGVPVGPFRVRAGVDARYVDADTFVQSTAVPTRDHYLEVQPRVAATAPVAEGHFTLDYAPVLRTFATYDEVNSDSHALGAGIDVPMGGRVTVRAHDRFRSGVLDTRVVDPGGEYFFGLGHFRRNDLDLGASITVGPRLSVELGATMGMVRFQQQSNFFDYDTRSAQAGLGFEVSPNLKAVASYVYDTVPRPDQRPEAEATAHSGVLSLSGEILPLLTGEVAVGYRSQSSPNAGPGGTSFSGLTASAGITRQLGRESTLAFYASRTTPVSAFEQNAFYVSSALQSTVLLPLPARFQFRGGLGYQWNDYRTVASAIGRPREDRILAWYVGLRRPVRQNLFLSGVYRKEDRNSNVDAFDTNATGFYFQLEWDILGAAPR